MIASFAPSREYSVERARDHDRQAFEGPLDRLVAARPPSARLPRPTCATMSRCQSTPNHSVIAARDRRADALGGSQRVLAGLPRSPATSRTASASARAAVGPTCRIDSATSTRQSGWSFAFSRLRSRLSPTALRSPASRTRPLTFDVVERTNCGTLPQLVLVEREEVALVGHDAGLEESVRRPPSRPPRCRTRPAPPRGRAARAAARGTTGCSGSGCRRRPPWQARAGVPQDGQCVGITNSRSVPSRSATTGPTISGITSPALRSTTVSPMSTPLRRTSLALCRVASDTVDPATFAGPSRRTG